MNAPKLPRLVALSRCEAHAMQEEIHSALGDVMILGANLVIDCLKDGDIELNGLASKFRDHGYDITTRIEEIKP